MVDPQAQEAPEDPAPDEVPLTPSKRTRGDSESDDDDDDSESSPSPPPSSQKAKQPPSAKKARKHD